MRRLTFLIPLALLGLAACGGGGGGALAPDTAALTKTSGSLTALNGQTAALDGVEVECRATGHRARTDAAGDFDLGDLPADIVDIQVRTPDGKTVVVITIDLSGGGTAVIKIAINEDGLVRLDVERCRGENDQEVEARARLKPLVDGLKGKVEIEKDDDGDQAFEVEVEHLEPGTLIEVFVVDAGGVEASQGNGRANAEGEAELELDTGDGETLPFGVDDVRDLEGFGVIVRDADGSNLLEGRVPALGAVPTPCRDHDHRDRDRDEDDHDDDDHDREQDDDSGEGPTNDDAGDERSDDD